MPDIEWIMPDRLAVKTGDITREKVDAIVNAANSSLMGGGGVDGAIHRAGGPSILEECRRIRKERYPGGLPAGQAVITAGGNMPCRHVIHTVGPVWHGGKNREDQILQDAYRNSLTLCKVNGLEAIAFPAISTGIYGFPKERAAKIVYNTMKDFLEENDKPQKVFLIFFSPADSNIFLSNYGGAD
jgi:O-acetyl-ADP-ribose deacetylase (regulator of RNase III)